ncbi:MAG: RNA polymerase sigma-70 factor [Humibacillus sp.]|nr:RNA polymerase sigma-70 factor [Humibacillus sp.]MDN5777469.1 RNA polymerase sigma-70 factor [Humibacillus sp.]
MTHGTRGGTGHGMGPDPFLLHRSLLFTVAYEMLGSAADAEDVVQETWLRWADLDDERRAEVLDARAYLVRVVTRQALNRLRTVARRREDYLGEWLPEPLLTSHDVADDVELAESVSIAMLTVLETLTPTERAVFVLREVFDLPYDEIAQAVGKTSATVRQVAHRAREHVAARRPRVRVDRSEQERVLRRFLAAVTTGDVQSLMDVLAPEVVLVADGGGLARAARHPLNGAKQVAAFLSAFPRVGSGATIDTLCLNGALAARVEQPAFGTTVVSVAVENGRITHVYAMRNPTKLARLAEEAQLSR